MISAQGYNFKCVFFSIFFFCVYVNYSELQYTVTAYMYSMNVKVYLCFTNEFKVLPCSFTLSCGWPGRMLLAILLTFNLSVL